MWRTRAISAVLLATLTLSGGGCAWWLFAAPARCGETPRGVVELVLTGISSDLTLILKAIPGGRHVLEALGGGDRERGREIVRHLTYHQAEEKGDLVDSTYHLLAEIDTDVPDEKLVVIERRVKVTYMKEDMREAFERYRRTFRVRFAPSSHCITEVKTSDPAWIRTDVDNPIAGDPKQ